jgi:hypothetical protein
MHVRADASIRIILLWFFFVSVCFGLGYPTLNRYDPRVTAGTSDSAAYSSLVTSEFQAGSPDEPRPRLLVPILARLIYWASKGSTRSADPVLFSLLLANSMFCAISVLLLISMGTKATGRQSIALLGACIYLLNFAIPNLSLSGLVDTGEACLILSLGWAMLCGRWWLLPILGIVGVSAKETFFPFSIAYMGAWWLSARNISEWRVSSFAYVIAAAASSAGALISLWSFWYGHLILPWDIAMDHYKEISFLQGLWRCITSSEFIYVFGWLLPLGLWKLHELPTQWVAACLTAAAVALGLGAWDDSLGNIARAVFNVAGPALSLSVALFLTNSEYDKLFQCGSDRAGLR